MKKPLISFQNPFIVAPPMLEIILVRHGQTDWNRDRRVMGARPIPLNTQGKREITQMAQLLSDVEFEIIYTSPLMRAFQTSRILSRGRSVKVEKVPEIQEIDYGEWVGRTFEDISKEKMFKTYYASPKEAQAPGGEKMTEVIKRGVSFIETLKKKHKDGRVVVVSHADVIKSILIHYMDLDLNDLHKFRVDNGSVSLLFFDGESTRVLSINCPVTVGKVFEVTDENHKHLKAKKK